MSLEGGPSGIAFDQSIAKCIDLKTILSENNGCVDLARGIEVSLDSR